MSILSKREVNKIVNDIERNRDTEIEKNSRREWLAKLTMTGATGAFLYACGSKSDSATAAAADTSVADGAILNVALDLELGAISIYKFAAADAGVQAALGGAVLAVAGSFLAHHEAHAATLTAAITGLKAKNAAVAGPVAAKADSVYRDAANGVNASSLLNILITAANKEMEAAKTYFSVISKFGDKTLAETSGLLGGDEAGHYGVYRALLLANGAALGKSDVVAAANLIPGASPSAWEKIAFV